MTITTHMTNDTAVKHLALRPYQPLALLAQHWFLIARLTARDVTARFRGSVLGLAWLVLVPLMMLCVYTFVFSMVFKARWPNMLDEGDRGAFALILFSGLIIYQFFAECLTRAPTLLLENTAYIRKVVFPLEILSWVSVGTAGFSALASLVILLVAQMLITGSIPVTALLFPVVAGPLVPFTAGIVWIVASLGLFLRDLKQLIGVAVSLLLFLSPIFYPLSAIPVAYRSLIALNPLTYIMEMTRAVLVFGDLPDWRIVGVTWAVALMTAWLGLLWFMKTRKGFADVV